MSSLVNHWDDLDGLLAILPVRLHQRLKTFDSLSGLIEIVMDLGRCPELRFQDAIYRLGDLGDVTRDDLDGVVAKIGGFNRDNRAGLARTLHRISAIRNRGGDVVGLTCRIGRAVEGTLELIRDVMEGPYNILFLGPPGTGKTTKLRETARVLANDLNKRVIVVDTSNEIAGDGDIAHAGIGLARRMQVPEPNLQHALMIEAVENHTPEVIIVDEIGTEAEAMAARTIAERGVQLIATAHGQNLESLIKNPTLSDLVGGIQSVILGDEEAKNRGTQKTVLERKTIPTFDVLIEIRDRDEYAIYKNIGAYVDAFLRRDLIVPELRNWGHQQRQEAVLQDKKPSETLQPSERLRRQKNTQVVTIFPFGFSAGRLSKLLRALKLPHEVVTDAALAQMVITTQSQLKRRSELDCLLKGRPVAVHVLKQNTEVVLQRFLKQYFKVTISKKR